MSPIGQMVLIGGGMGILCYFIGYAVGTYHAWKSVRAILDRSRARKGSQCMKRR